ncbi:TetR/AcrR family transcriptional regulator [uncultured Arthrobacter sp.]|uniref:TetR/AcrR family transcriptional regulator n=1 Tax=uncultured Arthrobacter sp. TaxID=114050 RepID=UPI00262CBEF4|nr:TetR/AcrR family transcriptional regulator [uncultured Arthrobacter sp.]
MNTGTVDPVPAPIKRRTYHAPSRRQAAAATRDQIVAAARYLFIRHGYQQTAMSAVAERAGVSVDTVYTSVGKKPTLVRAVIDDVLGEGRGPVTATERSYVQEIRATPGAAAKLAVYARALGRLQPDLAPLTQALHDAGIQDPGCREAWRELVERRASNMRLLAADLRATGELREDLDDDAVADVVWATNSPEYFLLLASRGWTSRQYAEHLTDLWVRFLLRGRQGPCARHLDVAR